MEEKTKIKNSIITLSGQPVSGKGTTVKMLVNKLKENGYDKENIHIIETGKEFRKYFNAVIDFIKNSCNLKKINELSKSREMSTILKNGKYRDALIRTISEIQTNNIDTTNFSIEQANNLEELEEIRNVIDQLIDNNVKKIGEEINEQEKSDEIWIIDSRLAFHNIPEAFSVRLTTTPDIAAKRLFNDKCRGTEDSQYATLEEAKMAREKRRLGEQKRYLDEYGVDLEDENNYNLIIDTSYSTPEDISDTILTCLECYQHNKDFTKTWTSPKTLLPSQRELDTLGKSCHFNNVYSYTMEELAEKIKKEGYKPDEAVDVLTKDGIKVINDGHHRNFASAYIGKTLIPYRIIKEGDKKIPVGLNAINSLHKNNLWGHEFVFDEKDDKGNTIKLFSYNEIYPGIYNMIDENEKKGQEIEI